MKHSLVLGFCRKHDIKLPSNWFAYCNCVRWHSKTETSTHFMAKAAVTYRLMSQGQTVFTEFKFDFPREKDARMKNCTADIFWLDGLKIIEIESNPSPRDLELKARQYRRFDLFVHTPGREPVEDFFKRLGV